jgi:hypothetical protein
LAAELWANDYKSLFELEASERPEIGQMLESVIDEGASTYRQQRRGGEMAVARHQSGVAAAQLSLAAQVRRLANVRDIPLLTAARSLSWLMTMARSIHYQEERRCLQSWATARPSCACVISKRSTVQHTAAS